MHTSLPFGHFYYILVRVKFLLKSLSEIKYFQYIPNNITVEMAIQEPLLLLLLMKHYFKCQIISTISQNISFVHCIS